MPAAPTSRLITAEIAGLRVADLVASFGTPAYVYDSAKIVERIEELSAFDVVRFAQKACSNLAIVDLCRRHGTLVDAVSAWEILRWRPVTNHKASHHRSSTRPISLTTKRCNWCWITSCTSTVDRPI